LGPPRAYFLFTAKTQSSQSFFYKEIFSLRPLRLCGEIIPQLQKGQDMLSLEELKKETDLINEIEWDMTPEEAVKQYLEWGNTDWGSGKYVIRSKSDYTTYFVVNCWRKPYLIYLIRRNSEEALELAQFELPNRFEKDVCELKGVYALDDDVKAWLKEELGV
jgi:hypothetical protein